jgi:3-phenylpropionate/trans-cinnamate dioxygenase ferredoxin reductase component
MTGIVIIGAGQAGASLAAKLRSHGYGGSLTLIGDESALPYQRPHLSKGYLLGEYPLERMFLRAKSFWDEQNVTLKLGHRVTAIDRDKKLIHLGNEIIAYDQLALTVGAQPRPLPVEIGGALNGVHSIRKLSDIDAIRPQCRAGRKLLIIGGGYIGLETAAVAKKLGLDVTLIEAAPRILQRVTSPETSQYIRDLHTAHGVRILENKGLVRLTGDGHVKGALLSDGTEIEIDLAIVGIGITPELSLAEQAGLECENAIKVDPFGRTSDLSIWSAGDCASFPYRGRRIRLESVGNAIEQAEIVAENMLGMQVEYKAKPWFWSDQYDVKLQIAGLNTGYDRVIKRDGEGFATSFWYYRGNELLAVDALNFAHAYMIGKRLIEAVKSPDPSVITDPATDLKSLLKA